jgi:hypothetical protein
MIRRTFARYALSGVQFGFLVPQELAMNRPVAAVSICLMGMTLASAAAVSVAQAQATKRSVQATPTTGAFEFRDPKTGQVWTPETVGQDGKPIGPDDRAFDPTAQSAPLQAVLQKAVAKPVGSVPITAGPTVPIAELQNLALRVVPGQRWQLAVYINNNSATAIDPVVECRFMNHGQPVTYTRAVLSRVGPGVRAGIEVVGPRAEIFVDTANCEIVSP